MSDIVKEQPDEAKGIRVFVYGTLKRGQSNHSILQRTGATYLGECEVGDNLSMVNLGWYPGVVRRTDGSGDKIAGEVYRVTEDGLYSCDVLEGHPEFYKRQKINTPWKSAWIYMLPEAYATSGEYPAIADGNWTGAGNGE